MKQKSKLTLVILWVFAVGILLATILFGISDTKLVTYIYVAVLIFLVFAFFHSILRYKAKDILVWAVIAIGASTFYENLSVATGFPYGSYHYTDVLGPKLIHFPVIVMLGYAVGGYLVWTVTSAVLSHFENRLSGLQIFTFPLIASFVMVMWDFIADPIFSTISNVYIWRDGGAYFGVPFANFMGWYLCMFTMFFLFAIYLSKRKDLQSPAILQNKMYWLPAVLFYLSVVFLPITGAISGLNETVIASNGQHWNTGDIYQSMTLVAITTVLFVALLSVINIFKAKELE